jgi:single-strand DNA-binding protein
MAARTQEKVPTAVNETRLVGRVSVDPERRELPSGDVLWSVRLVVERDPGSVRSRQRVDALECAVWSARLQRSVSTWRAGDHVEVSGALRRRFFRAGGGAASRVDVEVSRARLIRRATT